MLLRPYTAVTTRWHELTSPGESDRGDSPVPTVIIWIGIAAIAIGVLAWAATYIGSLQDAAPDPTTVTTPGP
ncbi:MAG TPA: hypothetical protein VGF84_23290 [Micromonosporaceae bacterium]|jgi:hypothetical protein